MSSTMLITENDVLISSATGKPVLVRDSSKLSQDINEFFTVEVQPSGFGAGINELIGLVEADSTAFTVTVYQNIYGGMTQFISLQNKDRRIPRSNVEAIASFNNVQVEADPTDPTKFYFTINVITKSGQAMQVDKTFVAKV